MHEVNERCATASHVPTCIRWSQLVYTVALVSLIGMMLRACVLTKLLVGLLGTGKYIGNRPCKLRKSTWKERSTAGGKSMGPSKKSRGNKHMSKRFKGTMTH